MARGDDVRALAGMDEYEQAKVIFGKIKALRSAAGGTMVDGKIIVHVVDIKNNVKVRAARREFFTGNFPDLDAGGAPRLARNLVEIEAIAHIGKGSRADLLRHVRFSLGSLFSSPAAGENEVRVPSVQRHNRLPAQRFEEGYP